LKKAKPMICNKKLIIKCKHTRCIIASIKNNKQQFVDCIRKWQSKSNVIDKQNQTAREFKNNYFIQIPPLHRQFLDINVNRSCLSEKQIRHLQAKNCNWKNFCPVKIHLKNGCEKCNCNWSNEKSDRLNHIWWLMYQKKQKQKNNNLFQVKEK
jgi:hypothetical protein